MSACLPHGKGYADAVRDLVVARMRSERPGEALTVAVFGPAAFDKAFVTSIAATPLSIIYHSSKRDEFALEAHFCKIYIHLQQELWALWLTHRLDSRPTRPSLCGCARCFPLRPIFAF